MQPAAALTSYSPLHDRLGRLSLLRALVFALIAAPALWMVWKWSFGLLSPKPLTDIIREAGDWAVRFLVLTLAISPLRHATRWNALIGIRRMLGLSVAFYLAVHLTFYFMEQKWIWWTIGREIVLRLYLTIGFTAVLIFAAMAVTSNDAMVKRLGALNWRRLHRLVYLAALLGMVHYFMQVRIKAWEPSLMAGLLAFLAGVRIVQKLRGDAGILALVLLAAGAGLGTALIEAGFYRYSMNAPFMRVFESNLNFEWEIRPAWYALAIALLLPLARAVRLAATRFMPARFMPQHPSLNPSSMRTETAPHR